MTRLSPLLITLGLLWWGWLPAFAAAPHAGPPHVQVGLASWYGSEWAGHETTSGEIFNPNRLTAASPNLPLGSVIRVTNLRNGKSVRLLVNDRGPSHPGRILDVSRAAARVLGFIDRGVTRVRIRLLKTPGHHETAANSPATNSPDNQP